MAAREGPHDDARGAHGRLAGLSAGGVAQPAYMLDGIDWRNPRDTFRLKRAG